MRQVVGLAEPGKPHASPTGPVRIRSASERSPEHWNDDRREDLCPSEPFDCPHLVGAPCAPTGVAADRRQTTQEVT